MFWFLFLVVIVATADGAPGSLSFKIINGTDTKIEDHPYHVAIEWYCRYWCGGAIISPRFVITAASCVYDKYPCHLKVRVGSALVQKGGNLVGISERNVHPYFKPACQGRAVVNDISILRLQEALKFSPAIASVGLPDDSDSVPAGTKVIIAGWGRLYPHTGNNPSTTPEVLQVAHITVVDHQECEQAYSSAGYAPLTEEKLCAGVPEDGQAPCCGGDTGGDAGGPLVYDGKIYGIISSMPICHGWKIPDAFVNVTAVRSFIRSVADL